METGRSPPSAADTAFEFLRLAVLMSWMVAAVGKEARALALARCSSCHAAFAFASLHEISPAWAGAMPCSDRKRLRRAPLTRYGGVRSRAPIATQISKGGRHSMQDRRYRLVPSIWSPVSVAAVHCGPDKSSSSSSRRRNSSRIGRRSEIASLPCLLLDEKPGDHTDADGDSPAAISELEPLVEQVASALEERCDVRGGDLVLVLVSGGSDSVALLLALEQAAKSFQPTLRVEAAHFNHALRGQDSDADQDFVVDLARRLEVRLHVRRWKGKGEGGTGGPGAGMQERARRWRRSEARDILTRSLAEAGGLDGGRGKGVIATAHHKDDQSETILLKALRGAHITKMQGMAWHAAPFVRPLLGARKSELVEFLRKRGQGWREDGSNQNEKYARNRVRLQLVPLLQELAGGARALDTRLEELSRQSLFAREMLEREAVRWEQQHLHGGRHDGALGGGSTEGGGRFSAPCQSEGGGVMFVADETGKQAGGSSSPGPAGGVRRGEFPLPAFSRAARGSGLPELVREELLHRFVTANTGDAPLPYSQLQLLMRQIDGGERTWSLSLGGGFCLRRVGDCLRIESSRPVDGEGSSTGSKCHDLGPGAATTVGDGEAGDRGTAPVARHHSATPALPWRIVTGPCQEGAAYLGGGGGGGVDCRAAERGMVLFNVAAGQQLHVRRKRDGDRFQPLWRDRPTKLKDFLRGQGVPLHRRDDVALVCDQDDVVIAVYPSYPAFKVSQDSTGIPPIHVRIEGSPLFCPCPGDRGGTRA